MSTVNLVEKLYREHNLTDSELKEILLTTDSKVDKALQKYAQKVRDKVFGKNVYIRGLIEVSNYCKMIVITVESEEVTKIFVDID